MIITLGIPTRDKGVELLEEIVRLLPQANCSLLNVQKNYQCLVIKIDDNAKVTQEQQAFISTLRVLQRNEI